MFNEAEFRQMLLLSLRNVNDYVAHIYSNYADLDGNNSTCGQWGEQDRNVTN